MKFEFELDKMPTTQQQKGISWRNGKPMFYNRKGTDNIELFRKLVDNRPSNSFLKPVPLKLSVTFHFAIKQKKRWWQWKTTRPDLDNLMKNLQDFMTKLGYYEDDSQIAWLEAKKYHSDKNKIEIEIEELKDECI
ncbi:RusA family crossover junction endodeoxyribonuclease [Lactococcus sp.]|uniref:RusA family crossover junction endodeoxyribonuclease n=1 Tax=Lactococcus sp. TaxID=44273 RepID=UPI0035AF968B